MLKIKCFLPDYQKDVTKKHDESLSFDYPIYNIYIYITYIHIYMHLIVKMDTLIHS